MHLLILIHESFFQHSFLIFKVWQIGEGKKERREKEETREGNVRNILSTLTSKGD